MMIILIYTYRMYIPALAHRHTRIVIIRPAHTPSTCLNYTLIMNNNSLAIGACCPSPNSTTDKRQQHNTQTSVHLTDLSVLFVLEHYYSMSTTELSVATATHTKSRGGRQRRQHVHERTDPTAVVGATIWPEFPFPLHSNHGHNIGYSGPALPDRYSHSVRRVCYAPIRCVSLWVEREISLSCSLSLTLVCRP